MAVVVLERESIEEKPHEFGNGVRSEDWREIRGDEQHVVCIEGSQAAGITLVFGLPYLSADLLEDLCGVLKRVRRGRIAHNEEERDCDG